MTPEAAAEFIDRAPWAIIGGSYTVGRVDGAKDRSIGALGAILEHPYRTVAE